MKHLLLLLSIAFSLEAFSVTTLDIALEAQSLKVEHIEQTDRGIITLIGCSLCEKGQYEYQGEITVLKKGKEIEFDEFLGEYWNIKSPTIFLDKATENVIRVSY